MGISDNYLFTKLLNINSNVRSQVERYSMELSTGKKINAPSEAPDDYPYFVKLSDKADRISQYMQNRNIASTYLEPAENALEQIWDNLQTFRQKVLYILNEPNAALENRNDIKYELENLSYIILSEANIKISGNYIFAGIRTDQRPFDLVQNENGIWGVKVFDNVYFPNEENKFVDSNGKEIGYFVLDSNKKEAQTQIDENLNVTIFFAGEGIERALQGIAQVLNCFNETKLRKFDDKMVAALDDFDKKIFGDLSNPAKESFSRLQSRVAKNLKLVNDFENRLDVKHTLTKEAIMKITDTDIAAAAVEYERAKLAYQASSKALSDLTKMSLIYYLE